MENLTISALLDHARDAQGVKSDYMLCKRYGLRANSVSHWRNGHGYPDEKACQKLAELAGFDPDVVIAQVNAMRANEPEMRAIWQRIAARLQVAGTAVFGAILSVLISTVLIAPDAYAASAGDIDTNSKSELAVYTSWILWLTLFFLLLTWLRPGMVQPVTFPWVPTA